METDVRGVEAAAARVYYPLLFELPTHLRTHLLVFAVLCVSLFTSVPPLARHHAYLSDLHVGANARKRSAARGVERNGAAACGHIYLRLLCQNKFRPLPARG